MTVKQFDAAARAIIRKRGFAYDSRGFLTSERHPEKGAAGNGFVTYSKYDARGHAGRKVDGASDLTFEYDKAARITKVRETGTSIGCGTTARPPRLRPASRLTASNLWDGTGSTNMLAHLGAAKLRSVASWPDPCTHPTAGHETLPRPHWCEV